MNRFLIHSAAGCLFAFAGLWAGLHGATGREAAAKTAVAPPRAYEVVSISRGDGIPSVNKVEQRLAALTGEYIRPWRQWESSPHRTYSRAMVREVPPIYATVELAAHSAGGTEGLVVATIAIRKGVEVETVPCVVDRTTNQVRLFAGDNWLTEEQWLSLAPRPF